MTKMNDTTFIKYLISDGRSLDDIVEILEHLKATAPPTPAPAPASASASAPASAPSYNGYRRLSKRDAILRACTREYQTVRQIHEKTAQCHEDIGLGYVQSQLSQMKDHGKVENCHGRGYRLVEELW